MKGIEQIHMGTFNAEQQWREENFSMLPGIRDKAAERIVATMDELLFSFAASKKQSIVTLFPFNEALQKYLNLIGFVFEGRSVFQSLQPDERLEEEGFNIFEQLLSNNDGSFSSFGDGSLVPYAHVPSCQEVENRLFEQKRLPDAEVTRRINSKIFSNQLHETLGLKVPGEVINSAEELVTVGNRLLPERFLIKDVFGVSGKGNILIDSEALVQRIAGYLKKQEKKGLQSCFLLEPFLEKESDFSCQFYVDAEGNREFRSIQQIFNNKFNYLGATTATDEFVALLEKKGYMTLMEKVVDALYQEGYYGDICIDSMILKNGEVYPIVEINARQSMGLINHQVDTFLNQFDLAGLFSTLNLGFDHKVNFQSLLSDMEEDGFLWTPEKETGVIPLSANTLLINQNWTPEAKFHRGRWYLSFVSKNPASRFDLLNQFKEWLQAKGFQLY